MLLAGALKRFDRSWPAQARALGAPLPTVVVPLLPWVEIVLGAVLVAGVGLPWSAWAAVLVLAAFTALLGVRLAQGRRPVCACFGRLSARPIGPGAVARNLVLLALAVLATG